MSARSTSAMLLDEQSFEQGIRNGGQPVGHSAKKSRALQPRFISLFISRCQLAFEIISTAITTKDKFAILISLFLAGISSFLYQMRLKRTPGTYNFMLKDITLRNKDGVFYCRERTTDFVHILPGFEKEIRDYFNLTEGVFVDVGAHIGKYTMTMGRRLGSRGRVIAFEPDCDNYRVLEKNISLNRLKNVILLNKALWGEKGKLKLYYPHDPNDKDTGNTGASTVVCHANWKHRIVEADTLDNVLKELGIESVDLIKIDVEGAEIKVLEGAKETLKQSPRIIFESLDDEKMSKMWNILGSYGYKIERTPLDTYYFAYKEQRT
ncbi:FkbM family methyltransferase [Dehalococcoidia bacterium]|nr:FkbM family methyltransferase [Dehalococcoidia bacterium]